MSTTTKKSGKEEILENLPPPEATAELLVKANKVSSWMSELKQLAVYFAFRSRIWRGSELLECPPAVRSLRGTPLICSRIRSSRCPMSRSRNTTGRAWAIARTRERHSIGVVDTVVPSPITKSLQNAISGI